MKSTALNKRLLHNFLRAHAVVGKINTGGLSHSPEEHETKNLNLGRKMCFRNTVRAVWLFFGLRLRFMICEV